MGKQLTKNQKLVIDTLRLFISKKGYSPTLREIRGLLRGKKLKLVSLNSLVQYLKALEEKGYIQRFPKARGIRLLEGDVKNFIEVPLIGNADCGEPLSFADDQIEDYINVSKKFIYGDKKDYFFVRAVGDSMNKEGINDTDYILAKKTQNIENGDNVLAVINGLGTIKKIRKEKNAVVLTPSSTNPKHKPIILHPDDQILICGKVEKVINNPSKVASMKN